MIKLFPTGPDDPADLEGANQVDESTTSEDVTSHEDATSFDVRAAVAAEHRPALRGRPWLYTNMVASADGGTAVDGKSGQLGGPADKAMFAALRAVADVILVGASTARDERYHPPNQSNEVAAERVARGQKPHPRLAVLTRSLSLDLDLPIFDDPQNKPYIVTTESAPQDKRAALEGKADLLIAGTSGVDLGDALTQLHRLGANTALGEGGPSINGQLIAEDLIDEWNLSLSPRLLGADSKRAAIGPLPAGPPRAMTLQRVWTQDDLLFCRWTKALAD